MPTYDILNTETNEVEEVIMTISGKEKYLKDNPDVVTLDNYKEKNGK